MVLPRVAVLGGSEGVFNSPVESRPFGFNRDKFIYESDPYQADYIYLNLHYLNCNEDFKRISQSQEYKDNAERCMSWAIHDNPAFAYQDTRSTKFLSQPLRSSPKHNIITTPLQMRHFEYELIKDKEFIKECRSQKKVYDYLFVGQTGYANRHVFRPENLNIKNYLFRETKSIYHTHNVKERVALLKEFCLELSKAKFCFCPRGAGSSSFRLYQSLMVGTIPLVYGMVDFPFSDEVIWQNIAIIEHPLDNLQELQYTSELRSAGIEAWDKYFLMDKTDTLLFERMLEKE